jgi:hypothetical protein
MAPKRSDKPALARELAANVSNVGLKKCITREWLEVRQALVHGSTGDSLEVIQRVVQEQDFARYTRVFHVPAHNPSNLDSRAVCAGRWTWNCYAGISDWQSVLYTMKIMNPVPELIVFHSLRERRRHVGTMLASKKERRGLRAHPKKKPS